MDAHPPRRTIPGRFLDEFIHSLVAVKHHVVHVALVVSAVVYDALRFGKDVLDHARDEVIPLFWVVCLALIYHAVWIAIRLTRILQQESLPIKSQTEGSIHLPSGGKNVISSTSRPTAIPYYTPKVWATTLVLIAIASCGIAFSWPGNESARETGVSERGMELEKTEILQDTVLLAAGKSFRMNYHFFNRGLHPLSSRVWGGLFCVDANLNSDKHMQSVWNTGINEAIKKFPEGVKVVVNSEQWGTAVSEPLTDDQIKFLKKGTFKMYFFATSIWKTDKGELEKWNQCSWFSNLGPEANAQDTIWHNCDLN